AVLAVTYDSKKWLAPTVYSWNLTIDREVHPGWLVRVTYAGSHSSHLKESVELNPADVASLAKGGPPSVDDRRRLNNVFPASVFPVKIGNVSLDAHDVNSSYTSFQVPLPRPVTHAPPISTNYT